MNLFIIRFSVSLTHIRVRARLTLFRAKNMIFSPLIREYSSNLFLPSRATSLCKNELHVYIINYDYYRANECTYVEYITAMYLFICRDILNHLAAAKIIIIIINVVARIFLKRIIGIKEECPLRLNFIKI